MGRPKGPTKRGPRLTTKQRVNLALDVRKGTFSPKELAAKYGISLQYAYYVIRDINDYDEDQPEEGR